MSELNKSLSTVNSAIIALGEKLENTIGDLCQLNIRVSEIEKYVNQMEQETKRNVVEIQGVPQKEGELLSAIIHQIGLVIGVKVDASDIDYVYRVGIRNDSNRPPIIVLRFLRQVTASEFLTRRRVKRDLSTRDIGFDNVPSQPVYINEALTQLNRKLYAKARELKRAEKFKYLWIRGGKIYIRVRDGGERSVITCFEDFCKFT
jgi:hypothetical protein